MSDSSAVIAEGLWNEAVSQDSYPTKDEYQEHVLKQYEICVEMADRISARRSIANVFFLTLHTFIIGALGIAYMQNGAFLQNWAVLFPLASVLALCFLWWRLLKSYEQLNTAKYKVIGEFEKRLPASPYWSAEWKELGEGHNRKLYVPLTHVEQWVPKILALVYVAGALLAIL